MIATMHYVLIVKIPWRHSLLALNRCPPTMDPGQADDRLGELTGFGVLMDLDSHALGLEEYHQYCIIPKFMYYPGKQQGEVSPSFSACPEKGKTA